MSIFGKSITEITEADLLRLVANAELEGKTLEYKRDQVGKSEADRKEFLYDVTSFANALGGHLIFGMATKDGAASELVGLQGVKSDDEILRLEQLARDGIRPPIIGLRSAAVSLSNGNSAIVLHIPKSWNPPHQVTYQKSFRFYGRDTNGKYQIDVDELRSIFVLSASAAENMKLFRIDRIAKIVSGDTPVLLAAGGKMVVHLLPLSAFTQPQPIDVKRLRGNHSDVVGVLRGGGTPVLNVDGLLLASHVRPAPRYAQVFRDGCVEVVAGWSDEANTRTDLPCPAFESAIIEHVYRGKQLFEGAGVSPPIVVAITLLKMKGWRIASQSTWSAAVIDRDPVFIPELVLEAFNGIAQNEVRPLIDAIWNAAGSVGSPNYNDQGCRLRE
ncbi:MAG: ATP-binding protein [Roseiarcus sp.]